MPGSGAKILLGLWGKSQEKVSLPRGAKLPGSGVLKFFWASGARVRKMSLALAKAVVAPVQKKRVCTSATDFFLTLAPEAQKNFGTTSWQLCPFWQNDSLSQGARITRKGEGLLEKL